MAYVALYRKFRPQKFEDVLGQEHVTKTLKNQIQNNRIGHAYLFNGGRGSGKTSTAKILSRAVNCLFPIDGEPCNECEVCKGILDGSIMDVIEMDAASNNGVDNIREIREEVEYLPSRTKYRVYIIDEVHMLSTGAFNALLKTLEEPPTHVIFILATTEPQKIPLTILSRCQRFEFKKISIENIRKRLKGICEEIGIHIEEGATKLIANLSGGAMRDAISVLDRCVSDGDNIITEEKVRNLAGIPVFEYLYNMIKSLITYDEINTIKNCENIIKEGKDLSVFTSEMIRMSRDILIFISLGEIELYNEDEIKKINELVAITNKVRITEMIEELSSLLLKLKYSTNEEIIFETAMIRLCIKQEKNIISDEIVNKHVLKSDIQNLNKTEETSLQNKVLTKLRENGKIVVHTNLSESKIEQFDENMIHIIFENSIDEFKRASLQKDENKKAIKEAVVSVVGKEISVRYIFKK